jgi:hypothetical protein
MFGCETSSWWTIFAEPMTLFGPDPVISLETSNQSEPKVKQFAATTPHLVLLNHSMVF